MYQNKQRLYCHVRYQISFQPGSFCNLRTHEFDFWLYYVLRCSKSVTPSHSASAPYQAQTYPSLAVMSRLITAGCRHTCRVFFSAGALKRCSPVGTPHNGFVVREWHEPIFYSTRLALICLVGSKSPVRSSRREN